MERVDMGGVCCEVAYDADKWWGSAPLAKDDPFATFASSGHHAPRVWYVRIAPRQLGSSEGCLRPLRLMRCTR